MQLVVLWNWCADHLFDRAVPGAAQILPGFNPEYRILLRATNQIAEGNLDVTISEDLGVFEPFKTEIQKIQSGFKVAVDEEVKSQKMKTDLITNMSHDLKDAADSNYYLCKPAKG